MIGSVIMVISIMVAHFNQYYRALTVNNIPIDIISPDEPFRVTVWFCTCHATP